MALYEKYLVVEKVSKEDAMKKVVKAIQSVKTIKQLVTVGNMVDNYMEMYGDGFLHDLMQDKTRPVPGKMRNKFDELMYRKLNFIRHGDER